MINIKIIIMFLIGISTGSFISLVIQRYFRNESIIYPGSHCDVCQINLKPFELVPIVSYLMLKGHCRHCQAPIPIQSLINEILFGALFIIQACFNFNPLILISLSTLIALSNLDWQTLMVPTKLVLMLLLNNTIYYFWFNQGTIITFIIMISIYLLVLFINRFSLKMGNGDIDIIFILLLVIGEQNILPFLISSTIMAMVYAGIQPRHTQIAFIPFLSLGYLFCLITNA